MRGWDSSLPRVTPSYKGELGVLRGTGGRGAAVWPGQGRWQPWRTVAVTCRVGKGMEVP